MYILIHAQMYILIYFVIHKETYDYMCVCVCVCVCACARARVSLLLYTHVLE